MNVDKQVQFLDATKALLKRLAKTLDLPMLHETADVMAADFVTSRLPPAAVSTGPTGSKNGMPTGLAPHEEGVVMRLSHPRAMRLQIQVDDVGMPQLSILHSVKNSRKAHMGVEENNQGGVGMMESDSGEESDHQGAEEKSDSDDDDDDDDDDEDDDDDDDDEDDDDDDDAQKCLSFPGTYGGVVNHLMQEHPVWFGIEDIPLAIGMKKKDRLALLMSLWWAGLLEVISLKAAETSA